MSDAPKALVGEFIDAVVQNVSQASNSLATHPHLLEARWTNGETVLHFLAIEGFTDGVNWLAKRGADVNATNQFGDSPLIDVCVLGNADIAGVLLRHGANPNARSDTRDNVLHCAIGSGNARLVDLLLEAGADASYMTDLGETVFDALPGGGSEREEIIAVLAKHRVTR